MGELLKKPKDDARAKKIVEEIEGHNAKIDPDDQVIKFSKMASSVLVFYRGTNHLFWRDFARDWRLNRFGGARTRTWLQGDLHVYNLGSYDNDEGEIVYELNDFDEAVIADYQYDVWRMATSIVLLARQNGDLSEPQHELVVDAFSAGYLNTLASFRNTNRRGKAYFTEDNTYGKLDDFLVEVKETYSRKKMLNRWAPKKNGKRHFDLSRDKLGKVKDDEPETIRAAMKGYQSTLSSDFPKDYFDVKDVAHRLLAGTGSLGIPRYYLLIQGEKETKEKDDRILDIKKQSRPTPLDFLEGEDCRVEHAPDYEHAAQWHTAAYRALTRQTDNHLGWLTLSDEYFSVRERSPYKEAFPAEALRTEKSFVKMATQWGAVIAAAHTRAGDELEVALPEEVGRLTHGFQPQFRGIVRNVAFSYADQVESDWHSFKSALKISKADLKNFGFEIPKYKRGRLLPV